MKYNFETKYQRKRTTFRQKRSYSLEILQLLFSWIWIFCTRRFHFLDRKEEEKQNDAEKAESWES